MTLLFYISSYISFQVNITFHDDQLNNFNSLFEDLKMLSHVFGNSLLKVDQRDVKCDSEVDSELKEWLL